MMENNDLSQHVLEFKQVNIILDHSIESDTRLMAFIDEVLTVNVDSKHTAHSDKSPTAAETSI